MTVAEVVVAGLLAVAVLAELASALGVLLMSNALDRLHFVGLGSIVGPSAIALAVWVRHGIDPSSVKITLIVAIVALTGPVATQVTARSTVRRSRGDTAVDPEPGSAAR